MSKSEENRPKKEFQQVIADVIYERKWYKTAVGEAKKGTPHAQIALFGEKRPKSAIHSAISRESADDVKLFISVGAKIDQEMFDHAALNLNNNTEILKILYEGKFGKLISPTQTLSIVLECGSFSAGYAQTEDDDNELNHIPEKDKIREYLVSIGADHDHAWHLVTLSQNVSEAETPEEEKMAIKRFQNEIVLIRQIECPEDGNNPRGNIYG